MAGHAPGASAGTCVVCGAQNTVDVTFTQGIGMVLMRQQRVVRGPFCHDCGLALGRKYESSTLITGWWGIISFFLNFANVLTNATNLSKVGKLPPPQGGDPSRRLDPGRPVFARAGFFVALAIFGFVALVLANGIVNGDKLPSSNVGKCVVEGSTGKVSTVSCTSPHDGKVVAVADDESGCPVSADVILTQSGKKGVYCVQSTG